MGKAWSWLALSCAGALCWGSALAKDLTVSACGDVMMQNVDGGKRLGDKELLGFMEQTSPWFKDASVGFVNLEGPIGGREPKGCSGSNCYRFEQGPLTAKALASWGIRAVSLANNHANDMGPSGQASTREALRREGIEHAGHHDAPSARWSVEGRSVELVAMTANGFAPDFRAPGALERIKSAKARSDVVIVSLHMGCEGEACARLKGGREIYLGEDRGDPRDFSKRAIDAGADLVMGSGPHVPRGMELHRGKLIAYSLGNCAAGPGISTAGKAGWAPVLWARLGESGELKGWDVGSFIGDGQRLKWDPKERALAWMLEATRLDAGSDALSELMAKRQPRSELRP